MYLIHIIQVLICLDVLENDVIKVASNCKKRIVRSGLNGRNIIVTINTWVIPLIHYMGGIMKWTQRV